MRPKDDCQKVLARRITDSKVDSGIVVVVDGAVPAGGAVGGRGFPRPVQYQDWPAVAAEEVQIKMTEKNAVEYWK